MMKQERNNDNARFVSLAMAILEPNEGQLDGLPPNPRNITGAKMELLKKDIREYPEMLSLRGLLVYPLDNGHYLICGGNMRYRAMRSLGYAEAPCIIIPKGTSVEKLKAYSVIDNNGFGKWDWDMLANEWDADQLTDWGVDLPIFDDVPQGEDETDEKPDKDLSGKVGDVYEVVIECSDESEQEQAFNKLTEEGYKCRVLTL